VFNWWVCPIFTEVPNRQSPVLVFVEIMPGEQLELGDRRIEMVDVNHAVPAAAYMVESANKVFVYSGDTTTNDSLWNRLNQLPGVDFMIIEAAFGNGEKALARLASHYCPSLLAADLKKLNHATSIGLSHFKPGAESEIFRQCCDAIEKRHNLCHLNSGDVFQI